MLSEAKHPGLYARSELAWLRLIAGFFACSGEARILRFAQDDSTGAAATQGRQSAGSRRSVRPVPLSLVGAVLFAQAVLLAHGPLSERLPWLPDRGFQSTLLGRAPSADDLAAGEEIAAIMRGVEGPVLSEEVGFVLAAGKPVVGATPPSLRALHQAGLWDHEPLMAEVYARRYDVVVLNAQQYPEPILGAIGGSYEVVHRVRMNGFTYAVMLPRPE